MEYLQWLGQTFGAPFASQLSGRYSGRRLALKQAMAAIQEYEMELNHSLLETLSSIPGLHIWGITDPHRLEQRVPTFSFTLDGWRPEAVADALGNDNIYVWNGNYYALAVTERLGLEEQGGMVRVGLVHYNTQSEIERLQGAMQRLR
jgi:selenocysteine lyase/cysteine desulfurase